MQGRDRNATEAIARDQQPKEHAPKEHDRRDAGHYQEQAEITFQIR